MNVDEFTTDAVSSAADAPFRVENSYTLAVDVEGTVLAKAGSMIAFAGDLSFTGKRSAEGGIRGFIKQAATGEGTPVMAVEGEGQAYLADGEKKVHLVELGAGESITVNGEDVLAFDEDVSYEITSIDSLAGAFAGGFTNVALEGPGYAAITTHGDPIVLEPPISTDPSATVAWSGVAPNVQVNKKLSDMVGQESGERYQMDFRGEEGFVVVQPFEERAGVQ